jgi:hypothetical protein
VIDASQKRGARLQSEKPLSGALQSQHLLFSSYLSQGKAEESDEELFSLLLLPSIRIQKEKNTKTAKTTREQERMFHEDDKGTTSSSSAEDDVKEKISH